MRGNSLLIIFKSPYDFYDLSEGNRIRLIGEEITLKKQRQSRYFPIQLIGDAIWRNYNRAQGLIYVSPILTHGDIGPWMRVAAFSPDDLDMDLDFLNANEKLRAKILRHIRKMPKDRWSYEGFLEAVQKEFPTGMRTS